MKYFILHITILLSSFAIVAQDVHLSQYYAVPQSIGPSFAGSTNGSRITANFRDQWPGISSDFKTFTVGFDHNIVYKKMGYGLLLVKDLSAGGALNGTNYTAQFYKGIQVETNADLRFGVQANYRTLKYVPYKLVFANQLSFPDDLNVSVPDVEIPPKGRQLDFGFSLLWYHENLWFGGALNKIKIPGLALSNSSIALEMEKTAFGGFKIPLTKNYKYKGRDNLYYTALLRMQGLFLQSNMGIFYEHKPIIGGVWYRGYPSEGFIQTLQNHDAIILMLGYKSETYSLCYSYDISLRKLLRYTGGAHEITFIYLFKQEDVRNKKNTIPCPRF